MKVNDTYKGFTVVSEDYSEAHKSTVIHLNHKSGLEVLQFSNKNPDNMVLFGFRTSEPTSMGTPHIMEHTVLCGSEKYKVKDPFISMAGQSMNTFLNAFTYPDFTGYPVSSANKKDFFNLASVYADAVFFPMLDKGAFMQEGHHLEVDDNGNVSIQGVVYNEMKGAYSNPDEIMYHSVYEHLFPGTIYALDSGGNPKDIPSLTYEHFVDFHKKWYTLSNCLVCFYGDIPTEELLDFLDNNVISKKNLDNENSRLNEYLESLNRKEDIKQNYVSDLIPVGSSTNKSNTYTIAWDLGPAPHVTDILENEIISSVLNANDCSYIYKAIIDSGLGNVGSLSGLLTESKNGVLAYSIENIDPKNHLKAKDLIFNTLNAVVKDGIKEDVRLSVINSLKYNLLRADKGYENLDSIIYGLKFWLYGNDIRQIADLKRCIDKICEQAKKPGYIENLIKTKLLENPNFVSMMFDLSPEYVSANKNFEDNIINEALKSTTVEDIKKETEVLKNFQSTFVDTSSLPSIDVSDLKPGKDVVERNNVTVEYINGSDGRGIPVFYSAADMPGIINLKVGFPVDKLEAADYLYLNLLAEVISDIGYGEISWDVVNTKMSLYTGYFYNNLNYYPLRSSSRVKDLFEKRKDYACRDYIFYNVSCLEENIDNVLELLGNVIKHPNFNDIDRISYIVNKHMTSLKNDFDSSGRDYVMDRVLCMGHPYYAKCEISSGLTYYKFLEGLADFKALSSKLKEIFEKVKDSGSIVFYACSDEICDSVKSKISSFIKFAGLRSLTTRSHNVPFDFFNVVLDGMTNSKEHIKVNTNTGYSAYSSEGISFMEPGYVEECALTNWLNTNALWTQLRTVHGCYGANAVESSIANKLYFITYRDPNPESSNEEYIQCLKETAEKSFTDTEMKNLIISTYGDKTPIRTVAAKANYFFERTLCAMDDSDKIELIDGILNMSSDSVHKVAEMLYKNAVDDNHSSAVFVKEVSDSYKPNVVFNC